MSANRPNNVVELRGGDSLVHGPCVGVGRSFGVGGREESAAPSQPRRAVEPPVEARPGNHNAVKAGCD